MPDTERKISSANRYTIEIDGCPVKDWSQISGLSMTIEKKAQPEGGNALYARSVTRGVTYGDLTLTRAVDTLSAELRKWVASVVETDFKPKTASIKLLSTDLKETITEYSLVRVVPIAYKGPDMGADKNQAATETVTLTHGGFAEVMESVGKISQA